MVGLPLMVVVVAVVVVFSASPGGRLPVKLHITGETPYGSLSVSVTE